MVRKRERFELRLIDEGRFVRIVMIVNGSRILAAETASAPAVTVRHPRTTEKELRSTAAYWARRDPNMRFLDDYLSSREGDVAKCISDIRKAVRKIAGSMRNAGVAKKLKTEVST